MDQYIISFLVRASMKVMCLRDEIVLKPTLLPLYFLTDVCGSDSTGSRVRGPLLQRERGE